MDATSRELACGSTGLLAPRLRTAHRRQVLVNRAEPGSLPRTKAAFVLD